jgi:4-alpha-glucanotransferase
MNQPATLGGNWRWRCRRDALTPPVAQRLLALTRMYDR